MPARPMHRPLHRWDAGLAAAGRCCSCGAARGLLHCDLEGGNMFVVLQDLAVGGSMHLFMLVTAGVFHRLQLLACMGCMHLQMGVGIAMHGEFEALSIGA